MTVLDPDLAALAADHGVEVTYVDVRGRPQQADPDALVAVLRHLGAEIDAPSDAPGARRAAAAHRAAAPLAPVTVAWDGTGEVRAPHDGTGPAGPLLLHTDDGGEQVLEPAAVADGVARHPVDGVPFGVHRLERAGEPGTATLVSAPRRTHRLAGRPHRWGAFAPLYALRDDRGRALGDIESLRRLATWAGSQGADWVATLPLLAGDDGEPVEASPYRPTSRLAWNECYLDLAALPELSEGAWPDAPGDGEVVDWDEVTRSVHAALDRAVENLSDRRRGELDEFLATHPELDRYARFRGGDRPAVVARHGYAQWCLHTQMAQLAADLESRGQCLYLDLPVGVHPDGYDAAVHDAAFAPGVSVGAPPDDFFADGQDWGFAPLHPQRTRADGHAYLGACLDHHLGPAGMLRLDHVMGLHRLWWIPAGFPASAGVYVRYPAEELYAVVSLASHRHRAEIVGENLGTVPPEVDAALVAHGLVGMWPVQLAVPHGDRRPPPGSLATVNTHDLAPFAAFWAEGGAPREAVSEVLAEHGARPAPDDPGAAHTAVLSLLGASEARHVQVALEDLWLEPRPQNRPGTGPEAGNWTRRARRPLEALADDPEIEMAVDGLEAARRTAATLAERSTP